jgi:hypothetical protein
MINNILENPFENSRLSDEHFALLAQGHLYYLKAHQNTENNTSEYTAMIALVEPLYNKYRKWLSDQETTITTKKGKTITVNGVVKEFTAFVTNLYDEIYSWKRKKPVAFNALFPNGKTGYNKMRKTETETIMQRLNDACQAEPNLKQAFKDQSNELLNQYKSVRNAQLATKGEVKEGSFDGNTIRLELATGMYLVLLDLIKLHVNDKQNVKSFYDAQFINPKPTKRINKLEMPKA